MNDESDLHKLQTWAINFAVIVKMSALMVSCVYLNTEVEYIQ